MSEAEHERPADLAACNRQMAANFAADPKPAKLYTGRGVPDPGFGEEGALYFDREARIWHGPKEGGDWGSPYPAGLEFVLGKVAETSGPGTGPLPEFKPGVERVFDPQTNTSTEAKDSQAMDGTALGEPQGGQAGAVEHPNPPPAAPGEVDPAPQDTVKPGDTAEPAAPAGGAKGKKAK